MPTALRITLQAIGWLVVAFWLIGGLVNIGSSNGFAVFALVVALLAAGGLIVWTTRSRSRRLARRGPTDPPPPTGEPVNPTSAPPPAPRTQRDPETASAATSAAPAAPEKATRHDKKARIESLETMLTRAANGDDIASEPSVEPAIAELRTLERENKVAATISGLFATAVRRITRDDVVTTEEEGWLVEFAGRLGLDASSELARNSELFEEVVVARVNDGRPPVLDTPRIILKAGETAYGEFSVALMKEVAQREFRAGTSGFSIPIGHTGVRYRVGAVRGRSVVVGTQMVAEDTGILTVTSTRAVFAGAKKTLEFRNDKLVSVQQYTDGLRLGVSNRQAASLFRFGNDSPTIAAALISYSTQH